MFFRNNWHWFMVGAVILLRTLTLGTSSYPVHHGYGEVQYVTLAESDYSFREDLNVLPMRYLPIRWSFDVFGSNEWSARFPGMVALAISSVAASVIGARIAGDYGRKLGPVFLVTNPMVFTWFGRALPDSWLVTSILITAALALKSNQDHKWAVGIGPSVLLGVASKPAGVLALFTLILIRNRAAFLMALASLGGLAFLGAWSIQPENPILVPLRFLIMIMGHSIATVSFTDVPGILAYGFFIGGATLAWFGFTQWPNDGTIPLLAFSTYALWDAIPNHAYYALPAVAWASVWGARWMAKRTWLTPAMLVVSGMGCVITMLDTGSLGDERTRIIEDFPLGVNVTVPGHLTPMFHHYRPDLRYVANATYRVGYSIESGCDELGYRTYGRNVLYALDCAPSSIEGGNT